MATRRKTKRKAAGKGRPAGSTKVTRGQIEAALIQSRGHVAIAAQSLGVTRQTIHNACVRWPELGDVRDLYRAILPEVAEMTIAQIVGDPEHKDAYKAASFILSRLAPETWGERRQVQITGHDGGPVTVVTDLTHRLAAAPTPELLAVGAILIGEDE